MNENEYRQRVEETFAALEAALDTAMEAADAPLDYESSDSILTIECEDTTTQVVISRQMPMRQIWVAAKSGGFHFEYADSRWCCTTTGESFPSLLSRCCSEQSNENIRLRF